jgi:hypothetical protein
MHTETVMIYFDDLDAMGVVHNLYIFSRPEQAEHVLATNAEHVLATNQDNYVKPFTYRPLRMMLGNGLLTAEDPLWRRHRRIIQPVFSTRDVASFAADMDAGAQRAAARWRGPQAVDAAAEMSAPTLDVVGRVLFAADLLSEAPPLRRALAAGQWLALLGAFLPIPWGPTSTSWQNTVGRYLPMNAGEVIYTLHHEAHTLAPWAGLGVFCGYAEAASEDSLQQAQELVTGLLARIGRRDDLSVTWQRSGTAAAASPPWPEA